MQKRGRVSIPVISNVTTFAMGFNHVCAAVDNGKDAYCWGYPYMGALGDGVPYTQTTSQIHYSPGAVRVLDLLP